MYMLRDKFTGRKYLIMKYGGMGAYCLIFGLCSVLLYTVTRSNPKYVLTWSVLQSPCCCTIVGDVVCYGLWFCTVMSSKWLPCVMMTCILVHRRMLLFCQYMKEQWGDISC